jgi:acyl-CoA thioesterase-1
MSAPKEYIHCIFNFQLSFFNLHILKIIYLLSTAFAMLIYACGDKTPSNETANKQADTVANTPGKQALLQIVFFGNSITAAYGLDPSEAFTTLLQQRIDSLGLPYKAVNAGVSGETSAGGASRVDWILRQPVDVFVLELGGNDGLRGIPLQETSKNLQSIIDKVKRKYPGVKLVLAGMEIPPNLGTRYTKQFHNLFPELAKRNDGYLIPFLLEGVGGVDSLNQPDGIHPNAEGEKIVAENAWKVLKSICQQSIKRP